jgi:hypothetical protein
MWLCSRHFTFKKFAELERRLAAIRSYERRRHRYLRHRPTDLEVFARAAEEGRILVPADTDFGTPIGFAQRRKAICHSASTWPQNVRRFNCNCC